MLNRKIASLFVFLCLCFYCVPSQVMAASTLDAVEPIRSEKECSLTLSYRSGERAFSGMEVKLYRVAEASAELNYTLTPPFESCGLVLNGIQSVGEWNVVRSTLESHILAQSLSPQLTARTDEDGQVSFQALPTGLYLAIADQAEAQELRYCFDSAFTALPGLGTDGRWQYEVSVNVKGELLPPVESEETTEWKVLKLWKGDENRSTRPKSIEVEIFCNGVRYESVVLSEENHWAYAWSCKDDGSRWTVAEKNVPQGYTATVEQRSSSFVLTNTWTPTEPVKPDDPVKPETPEVPVKPDDPIKPETPDDPPKTGDTVNLLAVVMLMSGSGCVLIVWGIAGKRSRA